MTLVERLRYRMLSQHGGQKSPNAGWNLNIPDSEMHRDAADEIETLRTQLAHWKVFAEHAEGEHAKWKTLARRGEVQLRKWSEWYGNADHAARGQLPLPPAGDVELAEDISAALGPNAANNRIAPACNRQSEVLPGNSG